MRVLFVDDDEAVCDLIDAIATALKLDLAIANRADRALELIQDGSFVLCVTDLQMPLMDGLQLAKELRERHPDMGIYAFTGESNVYSLKELEHTFDKVYHKPADYSRMIADAMKYVAIRKYPFLA